MRARGHFTELLSRWGIVLWVVGGASLTSVLLYGGAQWYFQSRATKLVSSSSGAVLDNPAAAESPAPITPADGTMLRRSAESFRNVAKKVGPAVVNIKSTRGKPKRPPRGMRRNPRRPMPQDENEQSPFHQDPFLEFFERFHPYQQMPEQPPAMSLGSGILIDKNGTVVTNNHVVEQSSEILISLHGEKTDFKAKLLGTDKKSDLAVLRIESSGREFPFVEWANSDAVEVGDWAIAIGSPFALGQSVTVGIVSAKGGRNSELTGVEYGGDLIQTDAAINPGNSGGPLCDIEARVMGVNTAIYTRSGGYMGIGFAIPSNLAKEIVGKLLSDGKIVRGWLGVYIQALGPELGKELSLKDAVSIHEVIQNSPAAQAGLKAGDIVLEVEGKPVSEVSNLQQTISRFKPGQSVKLLVMSYTDRRKRTVTVKIGELPPEDVAVAAEPGEPADPDKLGIVVTGAKGQDGVVVQSVEPGSVAHQSGLEPGDTIVSVNRKRVTSVPSYLAATGASRSFALEVRRKGRTLFFQFVLPK